AGHAYGGRWGKAALFFVLIMGTLIAGMVLGKGTVLLPDRLWIAPQVCAGGPAVALIPLSKFLATIHGIDWANRLHETGTLYTAVAGFLNLLVMMDAYLRLAYPHGRAEVREEEA
ncbi:MAG: hypothetical protein FJ313_07885, partial [Gemmatimonadetes bacterium]|nr:hypothetical protein [Gemmatimonadota bacterium]